MRPAGRVCRTGLRARPALIGVLRDGECRTIEIGGAAPAVDQGPVDERVGAVGATNQGDREVRAVREVHGEPVPAAAADGDEVAPLVIEPGRPGDREVLPVEMERARSPREMSASSSRNCPRARSRSSRCRRGGPAEGSVSSARSSPNAPPVATASAGDRAARIASRPPDPARIQGSGRRRARVGGIESGHRQGETGRITRTVARALVHKRPDLGALAVQESIARLVGEGEVRGPRDGSDSPLCPERDGLEPEVPPIGGHEMPRVIPPLGQAMVRALVPRKRDGLWIGRRSRRGGRRRHDRLRRRGVGKDRTGAGRDQRRDEDRAKRRTEPALGLMRAAA